MKYEIWTRKGLTSKLKSLHREVDDNNYLIEEHQRENEEVQEKIVAVTKALELLGGAWSPPVKALKKVLKKKVAKKLKPAKKVTGLHPCSLDYALKKDAGSTPRLAEIVAALEETCTDEGAGLSFQELFQAINARRRSKIDDHRLSSKLYVLQHSSHHELSFVVQRLGRGKASRYRLNRDAAEHFKGISKAFA